MPTSRSDLPDRCVGRIVEPLLHRVDVDLAASELAEEHEVVALPVDRVGEHGAVRERLEERRDLALHRRLAALIELHEQRHHAAGIQVDFTTWKNSRV